MADLCAACRTLHIEGWLEARVSRSDKASIGSTEEILKKSSDCSLCFLFAQVLRIEYGLGLQSEILGRSPCTLVSFPAWQFYMDKREYRSGRIDGNETLQNSADPLPAPNIAGHGQTCLEIRIDSNPWIEKEKACIVGQVVNPRNPRAANQLCQRPLRSAGIDFDLVRKWYRLCCTVHGERCASAQWLRPRQPDSLKVVNVLTRSLQFAPLHCKYAALSYVWGSSNSQVTLGMEEHKRLAEGPFPLPTLPHVVEDAMRVTKELGLDFLWIDALCIPQTPFDNPEKAYQLQQMNSIYQSAEVCIIAAGCKDVDDHIPGVRAPRAETVSREINGRTLAISQPTYKDDIPSTVWNGRAWTYQERMLARRTLTLGPTQAYWSCQCEEWCESVTLEPAEPGIEHFSWRKLHDTSRPPDHLVQLLKYDFYDEYVESDSNAFVAYLEIVQEYTKRRIGRPDDGLNAVAGILDALQRYFKEEWKTLHFGLPQELFDMALLWTPNGLCNRPDTWKSQSSRLPSWSWTGWMSNVGIAMAYVFLGPGLDQRSPIMPALQWYVLEGDRIPVPLKTPDQSSPLWHCKDRGVPCGIDQSRLSEKPTMPVADLPAHPPGYHMLCLTTTLELHLGPRMELEDPADFFQLRKPYQLTDRQGDFAGAIVLSQEEVSSVQQQGTSSLKFMFLSYDQNLALCGLLPEIQSVNLGKVRDCPERLVDWARRQQRDDYSVVNAMWIEQMAGGYYERRLVGSVLVESWLAMQPRTEWIVLG